ncbi:MAG TPA: aminotransferase class I/II-fold pyridoxal phosphate-dependent enzyme [Terriglobales bacterium]|jgi:histidinol-phosphate aminotransferase|nr:aminotransferase class I/II-fold pyridoxal phosphate-dependent enzyme [Terriglobales bacterium]
MHASRRVFLRGLGVSAAVGLTPIRSLANAAVSFEPARTETAQGPILLNSNENAYGPLPKSVNALQSALGQANRYPFAFYGELGEEIAALHRVRPSQIVLGCGSSEILRMTAMALLGSGNQLVQATPTYEAMDHYARVAGASVASVPLTHEYAHDVGAMLAATKNAGSLIYVCNPNNPTASLTPRNDLQGLISRLPSSSHLLIDEAYHHFAASSQQYKSFIDTPVNDDRVIVSRTFSKIYGLAGLRLGYAVASPAIAESLRRYATIININAMASAAALAALRDSESLAAAAKRNADDRQEFFNQAMARMLKPIDSQANFVMMNAHRPAEEVIEHFRKNNILIGRKFPAMHTHVRVSLGNPQEMAEFWKVWDKMGGGMSM